MSEEQRGDGDRDRVIAGNWKMHHGPAQGQAFVEALPEPPEGVRVLLFPPAVTLPALHASVRSSGLPIGLGIQNLHHEVSGAYTGEVSAEQAAEAGAECALVGHSERRQLFGETLDETARKVGAAYRAGLTPVLCVGETLAERSQGRLEEVLDRQLDAVFSPPTLREQSRELEVLVAYEPVWAIGTGQTATPDDADEAHRFIRARLGELLGEAHARRISILYGGSVKPANASELLAVPDVDGVLVGGASLDPRSFAAIAASE
jgi:triosephosphate isomerase (TIM)